MISNMKNSHRNLNMDYEPHLPLKYAQRIIYALEVIFGPNLPEKVHQESYLPLNYTHRFIYAPKVYKKGHIFP